MTEKLLNNTSIRYYVNSAKSETAIIFLHPAFGNHTCFDTQLDYFKNYKLITVDLIGQRKA